MISVEGSVDDSSATTTTFVSNLTETTDGFYHDKVIVFISGDLAGQARHIETYTGSTKSITVSQGFTSAPADADEFLILATHEHSINEIQSGLATAASIAALNDLSSADVTAAVPTAAQIRTEIDSNSTQLALLVDGQGYQLTILAGAISNAGTATEAFTFTYNSTDYAATYAGLDTSGKSWDHCPQQAISHEQTSLCIQSFSCRVSLFLPRSKATTEVADDYITKRLTLIGASKERLTLVGASQKRLTLTGASDA